jgi:MSHA biogenesis protein MshQ
MKVGMAPVDSDGVTLSVFDMDVMTPAGNDHAQVGQTQIRFGRLRLSNAHGSELLDLPVPMEAQYWNGTLFTTNTLDSCTTIALGNIALSTFQSNLAACETAVSISGMLNAGKANLKMLKPGAGNSGSVDLTVNLGSAVLGSTCLTVGGATSADVPANRTYLQGKWSGTGYDKNPSSRATFGVYKNANEFIYMREMY